MNGELDPRSPRAWTYAVAMSLAAAILAVILVAGLSITLRPAEPPVELRGMLH